MAVDEGSQVVRTQYHAPVDSDVINTRFFGIRPKGIYSGGYITITNPATGAISISALVCEIGDDNYQVRIETTVVITKTLAIATPYVVLRWGYTGVSGTDYMEIKVVATPDTNDLILGMGVWSGSSWTGVSYSRRSVPDVHHLFLKVEPTETASSSVRIRAGVVHIGSGKLAISDQTVSLAGYSAASVVYVYVTDTGGISHSTTASNYVGKPLLAKVTIPVGGIIVASSIEDARCFIVSPGVPDGSTIERSGSTGKLQVKALGIQNSHINSNVPDGTTIEKSGSTGRLQVVESYVKSLILIPRWRTYFKQAAKVSTPSSFAVYENLGSFPSWGEIRYYGHMGENSTMFQMYVNNTSGGVKVINQRLDYRDNDVHFYLNGSLVGSYLGVSDTDHIITWNLISGENLIQVILYNGGLPEVLMLLGDIINDTDVFFVPS